MTHVPCVVVRQSGSSESSPAYARSQAQRWGSGAGSYTGARLVVRRLMLARKPVGCEASLGSGGHSVARGNRRAAGSASSREAGTSPVPVGAGAAVGGGERGDSALTNVGSQGRPYRRGAGRTKAYRYVSNIQLLGNRPFCGE